MQTVNIHKHWIVLQSGLEEFRITFSLNQKNIPVRHKVKEHKKLFHFYIQNILSEIIIMKGGKLISVLIFTPYTNILGL
jgi:hypothetical protein